MNVARVVKPDHMVSPRRPPDLPCLQDL